MYNALRMSGFIKLPSKRTLTDYTHYFQSKPGFQNEVNTLMLREEVEKASIPPERQFVGLLVDEMKVKEGLIYNKVNGEIVGFVGLGDINQQLLELEQGGVHPPIANHVLVLMVCGLFFKLNFPYAHFGTDGISGELLYLIVWEAVRQLESCGLFVLSVTADVASPNKKFFHMHYNKDDPTTFSYKAWNPYSKDNNWLYFIADPPHLIKTTISLISFWHPL